MIDAIKATALKYATEDLDRKVKVIGVIVKGGSEAMAYCKALDHQGSFSLVLMRCVNAPSIDVRKTWYVSDETDTRDYMRNAKLLGLART